MRVFLHFLLLHCTGLIICDEEADEDNNRKRIIKQLARTRTELLDDYHFVTRQIATNVYMYRSYRNVSVVFYPMMREVADARFAFQSEEINLNNIRSCSPQEVVINIKHGSYPAVNPDGYDFPKTFIDPATREDIHTLELLSDGQNTTYTIGNPKPGNWYALVYIKWKDPRTQKNKQQATVVTACQTILYTYLQVKREENIELTDCYNGIVINYEELPAIYKCMALDTIEPISLSLTVVDTSNVANVATVSVVIQALSLPTEEDNLVYCTFDPKVSNQQTITFTPNPNAWHYVRVGHVMGNISSIADCESYFLRTEFEEFINHTVTDLMRDNKGRFFTFDYGLPTTDLQDTTSLVNITSSEIKSLRFEVNHFLDIGGGLSIAANLLISLKYFMGYRRVFKNITLLRSDKRRNLLAFTEDNQFFKAVVCMNIGHSSIPLESGYCKYNDKVKPAIFVLNSTDSESVYDKTHIPFPDSGTWYLTFRLFCDEVVTAFPTFDNGTTYYVDTTYNGTNVALDKDAIGANNTRQGTSECNASIVLTVSSTSCVAGRCSNHGNCMLNTFGGLLMSFCTCAPGYGNWACSDGTRMDSRVYMLVAVILLTLSNLLFFLSIYMAIIRLYYTAAMMYALTMVFSIFYHACDAPAQVAYCILRGNILQFGDFDCGIISSWVTLLAMAIIGDKLRSFLQLIGAIIIALLITWNKHSLATFLFPVAVGVGVIIVSWFWDYRNVRRMKYSKNYYFRYLPFGIILVSIGLICFAFLQNDQNYMIVHSIWHMVIALSIVFLLPDVRQGTDVNAFMPSNHCKLAFCKFFHRSNHR